MTKMTRRLAIVFAVLFAIVVCLFSIQSCNYYGGPGVGGIIDCRKYCTNSELCCNADPACIDPWDDWQRLDCVLDCDTWNKTLTYEFLRGFVECSELPCGSREVDQCYEDLQAFCDSNPTEQIDVICTKRFECYPDERREYCESFYEELMACYTKEAIDALESCTLDANCSTFSDDFQSCLEDELGIIPQPW